MTDAYVIARARVIAKAVRNGEPIHGCPHTHPDLVRAYSLGAASELLDTLAYRLEQSLTPKEPAA